MKTRRKRKKNSVGASRAGKALELSTQHQRKDHSQEFSDGVGSLQVGRGSEPGDVDVHWKLIWVDRTATRAIKVRLRLSKTAVAVLIVGGVLAYALISHDRELVKDGLQVFKSFFASGIQMHN